MPEPITVTITISEYRAGKWLVDCRTPNGSVNDQAYVDGGRLIARIRADEFAAAFRERGYTVTVKET